MLGIEVQWIHNGAQCTLLDRGENWIEFRSKVGIFMVGQGGNLQVRLRLGSHYEEILTLSNVRVSLRPDGDCVIVRAEYQSSQSEVIKVISSPKKCE